MFYERVFREFHKLRLQYTVIGGVAVNLHGYPRSTGDLDIIIALTDAEILKFITATKNLGMVPRLPVRLEDFANSDLRESWIQEKNMLVFSVYNPEDPLEHIDVKISGHEEFGQILAHSVIMKVQDFEIRVADIDDLIRMKGQAGRDRDQIDILALRKIKELKSEENK